MISASYTNKSLPIDYTNQTTKFHSIESSEKPQDEFYLPLLTLIREDYDSSVQSALEKGKMLVWNGKSFNFVDNSKGDVVPPFEALYALMESCNRKNNSPEGTYIVNSLYKQVFLPLIKDYKKNGSTPLDLTLIQSRARQLVFNTQGRDRANHYVHASDLFKDPHKAAQVIQRAFRKRQYIKVPKKIASDEEIEKKIASRNYTLKMNPLPMEPLKSNPLTKEKRVLDLFFSGEDGQLMYKNATHRTFEKFIKQLQNSIKSFNEELMSKPEEERDYVLLIGFEDPTKSNTWVTSLALRYLERLPVDIIRYEHAKEFRKNNPQIKGALTVDDASYSGKQLGCIASGIANDFENVFVIVPYMTDKASNGTRLSINNQSKKTCWIADHERMLDVNELGVNPDRAEYRGKTLTWFEHKVADHESTYPNTKYLSFPAQTHEPYKPGYVESLEEEGGTEDYLPEDMREKYAYIITEKGHFIVQRDGLMKAKKLEKSEWIKK